MLSQLPGMHSCDSLHPLPPEIEATTTVDPVIKQIRKRNRLLLIQYMMSRFMLDEFKPVTTRKATLSIVSVRLCCTHYIPWVSHPSRPPLKLYTIQNIYWHFLILSARVLFIAIFLKTPSFLTCFVKVILRTFQYNRISVISKFLRQYGNCQHSLSYNNKYSSNLFIGEEIIHP